MANKKFTLNFDASMNISQIKSAISEMQGAFSKIKVSKGLETNIQNTFKNINDEIKKFEELTGQSFHSLTDVSKASSSFKKIINYYKQLEKYGENITSTDEDVFFPKTVVDNIAKANKALRNYDKELTEIEKSNKDLEKQEAVLESLIQKKNALAAENKSLGSTKGGVTKKISSKEAKQAELISKMSALESQGTKKSSAEYKALASQYSIITQEIKKLKSESASLDSTIAKNRATMVKLDSQINSSTTSISQLKQELSQMAQNLKAISLDKLRKSLAEITGEDISKIPTDIENIKNVINNISDKELEKIKIAFDEIKGSVSEAKDPIDKTKQSLKDFGETAESAEHTANEVENLKNQVLDFFSISNSIQLFNRTVQSAFETVKELDATMTEAAVVTDFSVGDMWNQLPTYSEEATKLGATINDLYGATTLYYQQGLNTNEAMNVGIETMKMARIASMDSAEATQLMTAALRGFNMELNETSAQKINDVYSELAAITAADTAQIGTAMSKTASIAASANMEFETTAALLAQIIETTQEAPETAGTAMKTIIARFTEVKELFAKGQLTGEDSEGEAIDINKIDTALKTVGISLTDFLTGERGLDDILLELASKWDSLDIATQRYIATIAAGSRQQSRFLAMMSDYDRTMELVNAANNSAGASQEQFNKTMESLEAKLNKLKNAWDQFTMGIMDSSIIKFGIDLLTQILTVINNITEALPGPTGGFAKLAIAIAGLKIGKKAINSIFNSFKDSLVEEGEESGDGFIEGIIKAFTGRSSKISPQAKAFAGKIAKEVNGSFTQRFKKEKRDSNWLASLFDDTSSVSREAAAAMPKMAEGLITDFKKSISYYSLTDSGKTLADSYIKGFSEQIKEGKMQEAIKILNKGFHDKGFGKEGGTYSRNTDEAFGISKKTVDSIGTSAAALSATIAGIAGTVTLISSALREAGYEELASVLDTIAIGLGLVSAAFGVMASMATIAGTATWAALAPLLPIILPIVLAITAITTAIAAMNNAAYNNSAAKALKDAEEAADAAAKAVDSAKQAYDDLLSSFDSYDSAVEKLDELTVGTQAWKNALLEVNQQVLDLINTYPGLAKYITRGESGELQLGEEGKNAQKEKVQQGVINAQAYQISTNIKELYAQDALEKEELVNKLSDTYLHSSMGFEKETDELIKLYQENPEIFVTQQINQSDFEKMTPEEQKKLMSDYGYEENLRDLFIKEINRGNVYKYNDELLKFAQKMMEYGTYYPDGQTPDYTGEDSAIRAGLYASLVEDLPKYLVTSGEKTRLAQDQFNSLLTTRIDSVILDSDIGNKIFSIAGENYIGNFEKNLEESTKKFYQEGTTSDDETVQEELIKRGITPHKNELEDLQLLYADMMNIPVELIDSKIKDNKQALGEAIASMYSTDNIAGNIEKLYNTITQKDSESAQEMLDLLSENAGEFSSERLEELSKIEPTEYFEKIASELGMSIEELASSLGMSTEELASSFSESIDLIKKKQKETDESLGRKLLSSGASTNTQNMLTTLQSLTNEQKSFMTENSDAIQAQLGDSGMAEFLTGMSDIYNNESVKVAEQTEAIISSIDWSNPIDAVYRLNKATQSAEPKIQALGASLLATGEDAFGAGEQFRYFLQSADFSEISEDISELVEENGELTPENVEELAQSSQLLQKMLDNVDISAGGVAKTLTALNQGKIEIDDLTDSLLVAISNFDGLNEVANNAINTIENFDPGIDEGSVGDWVNEVREKVSEMYENGEYGNTQLQNYLKLLFGEEQWNEAIQEYGGNLKKVEEFFVNRLDILDQNLYGAWQELATNSKYQQGLKEFNQSMGTNIDIFMNDDGSIQLDTNGATTEQVVSSLMEAYNVSREYAEMMLTDFKSYSADLQQELAQNDWAAGLEDYVKSRTIITGYEKTEGPSTPEYPLKESKEQTAVFTDKEISNIAALTGKDIESIWIDIANTISGVENNFKNLQEAQNYLAEHGAILELLDTQGNLKSINDINTELNNKLGEGSSWAANFEKAGTIAIEDMQTMLSSLGIPEDQIEQLIIQQVEEAGPDTTFTIGGVELGEDDLENLKSNYKETIENAQKEADATLYADKVAEALTELDADWSNVEEEANTIFTSVFNIIRQKIEESQTEIDSLHGKDISVGVNIKPNQTGVKIGDEYISIFAYTYKKGSKGLPKDQLGILGDGNGAELVIGKDGTARVIGKNGPELTSLKKGDQIYTAEQTKKILSGTNEDEFPAYSRGYDNPSSQTNKSTRKDEDSKRSSKSSDSKSKAEEEAEIWENTFDWLYNLTQDINEELREREKLEKKYNRLIEDRNKSATDILKNVRAQETSLEQQRKLQQQMYDKRKQEMQRTLSEYSDVSQYGTYNWSDNTVEINWGAIDKVTDTEKGERIEEYISKLEEVESQMDDAEDALDDIIDEIEELQKVGKDEYDDLESRVLDAIISREQEKIDKLSLIDESINDANTKLMNSIQSNLDKIRQDRQNQETEQSIEDNERRLAYLQQDTSGANALEIQQLQEELANQKQDYTDTLIDQKLSAIQEQNDKASEERQYQIELAQAQLEEAQKNGEFWNEAYRLIKEGTDATGKLVQNSELTSLLKDGEAWESMSNIQKMDWLSELENTTKAAMVYFSSQRQLEKIGKKSGKITFTNANGEKLTGTVQKDGSVKVTTSKGTYTYKDVFQNYDGTYRTLETNPNFKANPSKSSSSSSNSSSNSSSSSKIKVGGLINAGKAQIYDYAGDKSGERQYFLDDPIYKVLDEQNGYLLTRWHKLNTGYTGWFKKSEVKAYAKGGLADFTGPAWLDGTKSKPELVLNARDTENFIQLKDILSNLLRGDTSSGNSGDNYFEIHIDVDSLNNDYDVEQLATKIKKMINDDARYRNVNSINLLR